MESMVDDFQTVREGLVRDGHDRFAALRRIEEQLEVLEQRHADLLDLARRVSNSFIAAQDRFGKERRRLLWQLRDAVEAAPSLRGAVAPDESGLPVSAGEQLDSDNAVVVEASDHVSEDSHTRETEGVSYPARELHYEEDGSGTALPELEDSVDVESIPRIAGPVLPGASPQDSSPAKRPT